MPPRFTLDYFQDFLLEHLGEEEFTSRFIFSAVMSSGLAWLPDYILLSNNHKDGKQLFSLLEFPLRSIFQSDWDSEVKKMKVIMSILSSQYCSDELKDELSTWVKRIVTHHAGSDYITDFIINHILPNELLSFENIVSMSQEAHLTVETILDSYREKEITANLKQHLVSAGWDADIPDEWFLRMVAT